MNHPLAKTALSKGAGAASRFQRKFAVHTILRTLVIASLLASIVWALGRRWGDIPALGELLEPQHGIWAHDASPFEASGTATTLRVPGLKKPVVVRVDRDQVKHVFAETDEDMYFAQGYLVASDRLWQMDFVTRVASGRLSEIVGRRGLEFDLLFIKLGIPEAAKETAFLMEQDPVTGPALKAYAQGVNAYVATLSERDLPIEFKLLGHKPEPWTSYRSALLLKFMAYNLAGFSMDLPLTRSFEKLSRADFDDLFSLDLSIPEPIVSRGTKWAFKSRDPEPPAETFRADLNKLDPIPTPHPSNGSNNWAVTGKKSTTGLPILSNDVHLGFSLPSTWYEIQLSSPAQNVYGVTMPGAPGVILGFNPSMAWGVTNGGTDVLDWYELRYRDEHKAEYHYDGDWRPVISREVQIKVRGEAPVSLTLRRTHFGPIVYDESETPVNALIPRGLAMRWAALDASNELRSFLLLNRARSTRDCLSAIETFDTPDQNFLCADNTDDVGLWHMGRYPIRWKGQGRMISDGTSAEHEWKGWIPRDELPFSRNPDQGYLASANQMPADESYPHYIGWPFESPFRAMRINEVLRSKQKFSPEDIVKMQADTESVPAKMVLPALLGAIEGAQLSQVETSARDLLRSWNYKFEEASGAGALYYAWFKGMERHLWAPRFGGDSRDTMYPPLWRTVRLIKDEPTSKWFDDPTTDALETLNQVALSSFKEALVEVMEKTGEKSPANWRWTAFRSTQFPHLGRLPGLGDMNLKVRGMEHTIFANHGVHGPVWKLVVALGPKPRAWGIYPGGQSGDPTSAHYDDFLEPWRQGKMREILFLSSPNEKSERLQKTWTMEAR